MNSVKACIFDLDGTLLYTLESIAHAGNRMLGELGYPPRPVEEYRFFCGDGSDELVRRALAASGGLTEENLTAGKILNRKYISEMPLYHVRPYEGVPEMLAAMKARGTALAVVSNKPDRAAQDAIRGVFGDLFDYVAGQTPALPVKPDPAIALGAARALSAKPEECLYFGDSGTDMKTGKAASMRTIGVLWGYRDAEELLRDGADDLIASPQEALSLTAFLS